MITEMQQIFYLKVPFMIYIYIHRKHCDHSNDNNENIINSEYLHYH